MKSLENQLKSMIDKKFEKITLNELFSKRNANLAEIVDGADNPTSTEILNSDDFLGSLFSDLVMNRNISNWQIMQKAGSMEDIDNENQDSLKIDYDFKFTYNYKGIPVGLNLFMDGEIYIRWQGRYRPQTHTSPAEHPQPYPDQRTMGEYVNLSLYDDEGEQINIDKLTPDLKLKVVKAILSPYL